VAGRPVRLLDPDALVGACTVPGVPGLVPHPEQSLALVPGWVLGQLAVAQHGVIALGVDGLGWAAAATTWRSAELACLTSTFPTISATAWLTALTGVGPAAHLVAGNSYLVPDLGVVVDATTATPQGWPGQPPPVGAPQDTAASQLVVEHPTLFERAAQQGAAAVAVTRELDGLPGPWTHALLRGADRWDGHKTSAGVLQAQAADPRAMPLKDYLAEVIEIIKTQPNASEILVERVKPLRFAEQNGKEKYDAFFQQFNDAMMAPH